MNVAIILAAGLSKRFINNSPKQLYLLNNKPIINHSIDIISQLVDDIVIVTNSSISNQIETNQKIVINDKDNRIESIKTGVDFILNKNYDNIIIHDSARPFVEKDYFQNLIDNSNHFVHCQYYLELINGLAKKTDDKWEIAPRENFIELCSPQITNYEIFKDLFYNYILKEKDCEILPIVSQMNLNYKLIKGHYKHLRKITTLEDIY